MRQVEREIQTITDNSDIQVGYSDNDVIIIDSVQEFASINATQMPMSAVVLCVKGKVQGTMGGQLIQIHENQVCVVPNNVMLYDMMFSPDFDVKAMLLTNRILQSFLREKMSVWYEMMYVRRFHVLTMEEDDIQYYKHFYDMLSLFIKHDKQNPFFTDIVQSLLRSAVLALCGALKLMAPSEVKQDALSATSSHFQRFLDLLASSPVKHRPVEEYANELCLSPKYLSAICKKNSGKTANEWITEHTMEDVRYYLRQTSLTIKQIADRLGFPNPSFFGKYVKHHSGMTPNNYRQKFVQEKP